MNLNEIPASVILFAITQTGLGIWALVKMYFKLNSLSDKVVKLEEENKELRTQLKEVSDTLLIVKNNTDLLVLGKLKTGNNKQAA